MTQIKVKVLNQYPEQSIYEVNEEIPKLKEEPIYLTSSYVQYLNNQITSNILHGRAQIAFENKSLFFD